jgi:phosphoribosylamine--glycine ligase
MKVLVIGQGGREHAIVKGLKFSASVTEVHVIPGNPGMAREAICHQRPVQPMAVIELVKTHDIDYVIIGPEAPLVNGLSDELRDAGIKVFGPSAAAAQLEGSKIFAKDYMNKFSVPTARSFVVETVESCLKAAAEFQPPYILKADGLAGGKGVFICKDLEELEGSARAIFEENKLGKAGSKALLEEALHGYEISYFVLTDGKSWKSLPFAQDHKRLLNGDSGPNTGGMGAVAPVALGDDLIQKIETEIVKASVEGLAASNMDYRGVLFIGIMVTQEGPKVLEYNVRFGDPETQVVLPLFESDLGQVLADISDGRLPEIIYKDVYAATVVMAAPGYPEDVEKGVEITGDILGESSTSYFIHAGTELTEDNKWLTAGGRVLNAVGFGNSMKEAIDHAYSQSTKVKWRGMQKRTDIGAYSDKN